MNSFWERLRTTVNLSLFENMQKKNEKKNSIEIAHNLVDLVLNGMGRDTIFWNITVF